MSEETQVTGVAGRGAPLPGATTVITGAQRYEVLAAVMAVMFFSSMASTVVSTALPNIVADLNGLSLYAWVFTAFILASAVVIPVYGKLSDVVGRKPLYVVAITLYVVGNAIGGFAHSMEVLVASRAIAGLGGGGMQALSQITIGDIFTPQERGRWMGVIMSAFGLASIIGPTVGGWVTDNFGWHWVFWMNIPLAIIPLAALLYALPNVRLPGSVRIDYLGIGLLIVGLVPVLLAITWLGEGQLWTSARVAGSAVFGLVVLAFFLRHEMHVDEPVINPAFFRNRIFVVCMVASFCIALGMYGAIMFIPLFVQGVVGTSAQDSGVVLSPMMIGFIAGSTLSGQLVSRWGRYRLLALGGLLVACVGTVLFGLMDASTTNLQVIRNMVIFGIGIGSTLPLFTIAVQNAFPYKVLGAVTGTRQFFMSLGGAIGVPVMGALLDNGFSANVVHYLTPSLRALMARQHATSLNPTALVSAQAQTALRAQFAHLGPSGAVLYRQFLYAIREGLAVTMHPLFHVALACLAASWITTLFLREIPLRRHVVEARAVVADEEAAVAGAPTPIILRGEAPPTPAE